MRHKLSQYQRLLQKMALTPQMRQSIQLLGMHAVELSEYIDEILEKNPFLQKEYDKKPPSQIIKADYEPQIVKEEDPRLLLLSQIRMLELRDKDVEIAEYLIYELDDNGYLQADLDEAANDLGVDADDIEGVVEVLQKMDPPGIGARDVRECLQLQLKRMGKEDSLEYRIVTNCINELATDNAKKIAHSLKIDEKKASDAMRAIKKLNPRPASSMLAKKSEAIIPDLVASIKGNKVTLALNRTYLPHLKLYNPYEDKLDIIKDDETREFLKTNMEAAKNLIDGLKRREETMCRVADYILKHQVGHFSTDKHEIKSLTIKEVAEALKLHPSTINRTVFRKYIQIDNKVITLRTLLSKGVKKANGDLISKSAIQKRIELLIKGEDKTRPLSDEVIMKKLVEEGIEIKRRTVAKYRTSLHLLPTHLRKKVSAKGFQNIIKVIAIIIITGLYAKDAAASEVLRPVPVQEREIGLTTPDEIINEVVDKNHAILAIIEEKIKESPRDEEAIFISIEAGLAPLKKTHTPFEIDVLRFVLAHQIFLMEEGRPDITIRLLKDREPGSEFPAGYKIMYYSSLGQAYLQEAAEISESNPSSAIDYGKRASHYIIKTGITIDQEKKRLAQMRPSSRLKAKIDALLGLFDALEKERLSWAVTVDYTIATAISHLITNSLNGEMANMGTEPNLGDYQAELTELRVRGDTILATYKRNDLFETLDRDVLKEFQYNMAACAHNIEMANIGIPPELDAFFMRVANFENPEGTDMPILDYVDFRASPKKNHDARWLRHIERHAKSSLGINRLTLKDARALRRKDTVCLAVRYKGRIVGFVLYQERASHIEILNMLVLSEYKNLGIEKMLFEKLKRRVDGAECESLIIKNVNGNNKKVMALLREGGFVVGRDGIMRNWFGAGMHAYTLRYEITGMPYPGALVPVQNRSLTQNI